MVNKRKIEEYLTYLVHREIIHEGQKKDVLNRGMEQARHVLVAVKCSGHEGGHFPRPRKIKAAPVAACASFEFAPRFCVGGGAEQKMNDLI